MSNLYTCIGKFHEGKNKLPRYTLCKYKGKEEYVCFNCIDKYRKYLSEAKQYEFLKKLFRQNVTMH